mmetsp:Transcript_8038/g.17937  ORF Transcript_8038/g.17937 Transcript_8038/m.17937 type:complete len:216 (+) Transcript_8038:733-1380(+)
MKMTTLRMRVKLQRRRPRRRRRLTNWLVPPTPSHLPTLASSSSLWEQLTAKRSIVVASRRLVHPVQWRTKESSRRRRLWIGMSTGCLVMAIVTRKKVTTRRILQRMQQKQQQSRLTGRDGDQCLRPLRRGLGSVECVWYQMVHRLRRVWRVRLPNQERKASLGMQRCLRKPQQLEVLWLVALALVPPQQRQRRRVLVQEVLALAFLQHQRRLKRN